MTHYEHLEQLAASNNLPIDTSILQEDDAYDGLFLSLKDGRGIILINRLRSLAKRTAALAEELGHYFKSVGDLRDLQDILAAKSENLGRAWSYQQLLPRPILESQLKNGNGTPWELAEATGLPEDFVLEAVTFHSRRSSHHLSVKTLPPEVRNVLEKRVEQETLSDHQTALPKPQPLSFSEISMLAVTRYHSLTGRFPNKRRQRELSFAFRTEIIYDRKIGLDFANADRRRNTKKMSKLIRHLYQECFEPGRCERTL